MPKPNELQKALDRYDVLRIICEKAHRVAEKDPNRFVQGDGIALVGRKGADTRDAVNKFFSELTKKLD